MVRSGLSSQSSGGLFGRLEALEDGDWAGVETLDLEERDEGELKVFDEAESEGRSEYPVAFPGSEGLCVAKLRSSP